MFKAFIRLIVLALLALYMLIMVTSPPGIKIVMADGLVALCVIWALLRRRPLSDGQRLFHWSCYWLAGAIVVAVGFGVQEKIGLPASLHFIWFTMPLSYLLIRWRLNWYGPRFSGRIRRSLRRRGRTRRRP